MTNDKESRRLLFDIGHLASVLLWSLVIGGSLVIAKRSFVIAHRTSREFSEPLLQHDVYALMERLLDGGRTVLLETGGQVDVSQVPGAVVKVMDVKCPGSGEALKMHWPNLDAITRDHEVKFVIADRADYEYARKVISTHDLGTRAGAVLLSPVHGVQRSDELVRWMLEDHLPARLQIQAHKYIWTPETRGV